jgi:hypothetical protein
MNWLVFLIHSRPCIGPTTFLSSKMRRQNSMDLFELFQVNEIVSHFVGRHLIQ